MTAIGIHDIEVATGHHVVNLTELAEARGVDPNKYIKGLGQDEFSFPAPDEDVVTMGATAAHRLLERTGAEGIRTLLFATETGVDQSKSTAVFVHKLLDLPGEVRSIELKQACYSGTGALQAALGIIARNPGERVLVISSDIARYELDSPGEPTQGAGAVAMLVSADPALVEIEPASGVFSEDVDDFWRPNDSSTAVVDGGLSITAYLKSVEKAWKDLEQHGGPSISDVAAFVYHQPFTKMARKAQAHLAAFTGTELNDGALDTGSVYNRRMGNSYTASLYSALTSLLHHEDGLTGKRVGLVSYGSGSVAEILTGIVRADDATRRGFRDRVLGMLDSRVRLSVPEYEGMHEKAMPSAEDTETAAVTKSPFRFAGVRGRARHYERA
ncbi:hydroxymethylglutaryl-CoA synthase [Dietzia sp.]|uniref:hydroxymethylglutaryl-CoA synthase n=1 Tax=Dietzia sp. TaxID=1871616 RepID=UPI002FDA022B